MSHNVDKDVCKTCAFWIGKKSDKKHKCYSGFCPTKLRDKK